MFIEVIRASVWMLSSNGNYILLQIMVFKKKAGAYGPLLHFIFTW